MRTTLRVVTRHDGTCSWRLWGAQRAGAVGCDGVPVSAVEALLAALSDAGLDPDVIYEDNECCEPGDRCRAWREQDAADAAEGCIR